jgi:DNA polymerase-4
VKVKYGDFQIITRSRTNPAPVDSHQALRAAARALIRSVLPTEKGIRLVGVSVSNFKRSPGEASLPLFAEAVPE